MADKNIAARGELETLYQVLRDKEKEILSLKASIEKLEYEKVTNIAINKRLELEMKQLTEELLCLRESSGTTEKDNRHIGDVIEHQEHLSPNTGDRGDTCDPTHSPLDPPRCGIASLNNYNYNIISS